MFKAISSFNSAVTDAEQVSESVTDAFLPDRTDERDRGPRQQLGLESDASAQNRKNLTAYRALGALVAKLTQS